MGRRKFNDEDLAKLTAEVRTRTEYLVHYELTPEEYDAGLRWYALAHSIARDIGDIDRTSAMMAALSPRVRWAANIEDTVLVWSGLPEQTMALGANRVKAMRIADGEDPDTVLGGRKVRSFWRNIRYPHSSLDVTLDGWMARAYGLEVKALELYGVYDAISDGIRQAAEDNALMPHQVQAMVWIHERGSEA